MLLTVVSISFDVPANVNVSPLLNVSFDPLSAAKVKLVDKATVPAAVN